MSKRTSHFKSNVAVLVYAFFERRVSASFFAATRMLSEVSGEVYKTNVSHDP